MEPMWVFAAIFLVLGVASVGLAWNGGRGDSEAWLMVGLPGVFWIGLGLWLAWQITVHS